MATTSTKQTRYGVFEERSLQGDELPDWLRTAPTLLRDPYQLTWSPSPELAGNLPADLSCTFRVFRGSDGHRRIVPANFQALLKDGWLAGLEIARCAKSMSKEQVFSYRVMRFLFERIRSGREHLGRDFSAARDLYVRTTGRGGKIQESLLPEYVGRTADGGGHTWSIHELTKQGRQAAILDGVKRPNNKQAVRYGLTVAAELNPLRGQTPKEIRRLVFAALLDTDGAATSVTDAEVADVTERVCVAFAEQQAVAGSKFQAWFDGPKNNLIKSLARKAGFSVLDRQVVKAALVKLGMQSYDYMAQCLSLFAQAVRQGLSEPLNERERRQFDAMYMPEPAFGELPLLLLWERKDLLRNILQRLWNDADDEHLIGALHRLLAVYGALAPARREADRRFKELKPESRGIFAPSLHGQAVAEDEAPENSSLREAVESLIEVRGLGCLKCRRASQCEVSVDWSEETGAAVQIACERHAFQAKCSFTLEDLRSELQRLSSDSTAP